MSEVSHFTDFVAGESRRTSIVELDHELDHDVTEFIDFKPLYKCVHINSLLGQRDQFIFQYRNRLVKRIMTRVHEATEIRLRGEISASEVIFRDNFQNLKKCLEM